MNEDVDTERKVYDYFLIYGLQENDTEFLFKPAP